jgi:hypothetical protein
MFLYLRPQWNGDLHQIERFAEAAVARTRSIEGESMYARIYWYASQAEFANDLFFKSFARWDRVNAGFKDILARYPDDWNLNHYAKFACLAGDAKTTAKLLARIHDPLPQAWQPEGLFRKCAESAGIRSL